MAGNEYTPEEIEAFEKLVYALEDYFEYNTLVRFERLLRAFKPVRKFMGYELSWAAAYSMLKNHIDEANKVWGADYQWPEDL